MSNGFDYKSSAKELLLADYKYLSDSFWKNEETGETRVRFFIMLVTAVLAAIGTLLAKAIELNRVIEMIPICLFALFALFMFGLVTLFRILKRNEVTDGYKKDMNEIRRRFKHYLDDDSILTGYAPFGSGTAKEFEIRKFGGLAHTVSIMNSLIVSAIIGLAVPQIIPVYLSTLTVIITFIACFAVQYDYIRKVDLKNKDQLRSKKQPYISGSTHAGGLVYKMNGKEPLFLIITATDTPSHWVLPKGHIENKEFPVDTAVREVEEETGVIARVIDFLGTMEFQTKKEHVKSRTYLMEYIKEEKIETQENRQQKWCTSREALKRLTFDDSKQLVQSAEHIIKMVKYSG
jgi:8-oxo-dGTP pyrophosphatase MutT (NUDIX family)